MKIRIKGNSIRYRLTRSEVEMLKNEGYLKEQTSFNQGVFTYEIKAKSDIPALSASFRENTITLLFPIDEKDSWPYTKRVGFENLLKLEDGSELHLLLEKDFVCMDETVEDQSDNYPNPAATQ